MGIRGSRTCDLVFDDCRIPAENLLGKEGEGFKIAMQTLDVSRAFIGCIAVGIAQRAMEEAIAYGKSRIQFGKPIVSNQVIAFKLADMEIQIETARQMVAHACTLMDMANNLLHIHRLQSVIDFLSLLQGAIHRRLHTCLLYTS